MSKQISFLNAPDLPQTINGDGRYLMTLLRRYLGEMAEQVNLANGFTAQEETGNTGISPPPNLTLTFSSAGGLFQWTHPAYYNSIDHYEVRIDKSTGAKTGLLEATKNNYATKMPINFAGTVYLYAVLKDGTFSNGAVLNYTKARPEKPSDISITKNEQGTLINYTWIPLDCMGAHVYVNGTKYETVDNWLLYQGNSDLIQSIEVSYYDCFGEGERAYLYCKVPDVTDFIVERNGAVLDFYWAPVNVHGVKYEIRVSQTPEWSAGVKLFETSLVRKKLEYPKSGTLYFLIKACDEHGNYSSNAAWYTLATPTVFTDNVIIDFNEDEKRYSGVKINTFYDAQSGGLRISDGEYHGEYISKGALLEKYRARSWADYSFEGIINTGLTIKDLTFSVLDEDAQRTTMTGGTNSDLTGVEVRTYISEESTTGNLLDVSLMGKLSTLSKQAPDISAHCDTFKTARWGDGVALNELSRLKYSFENTSIFGVSFNIRLQSPLEVCTIARLEGDGYLELSHNQEGFRLSGTSGAEIILDVPVKETDSVTIGISQTADERTLYIKRLGRETFQSTVSAIPIGIFNSIQFHKGE